MATVSVADLHHVALAVPDLDAERRFFAGPWGLEDLGERDGRVAFAAAGSPVDHLLSLRRHPERQTDLIGYSVRSESDLATIHAQALAHGARNIAEPGPAPGGGMRSRFFDPDGRAIELSTGVAARRESPPPTPGAGVPTGLSHIVLHSPDVPALAAFYQQGLGFRVSDWIDDFMVFLRCNEAHHRVAIMRGPPALNHVAFSVPTVDDLMCGLGRLSAAGVPLQWGPGRHTAGNNTFSYYLTPNGNAVETTSDLEDVDDASWVPTTYPMGPKTTDRWGTGRLINANAPHQAQQPDRGLWQVPA